MWLGDRGREAYQKQNNPTKDTNFVDVDYILNLIDSLDLEGLSEVKNFVEFKQEKLRGR